MWCRQLQTVNDQLSADVQYLSAKCHDLEQRCNASDDRQEYFSRVTTNLDDHVDKLEAFSRRNNVRFFNVYEGENEDYDSCCEKVVRLMNQYYPRKTWQKEDVERAHRVGPRDSRHPRPLIAHFHHWPDKLSLLSERTCRQAMADDLGIRVAADLTDRQQEEVRRQREQGRSAYYRRGRLHVRERRQSRPPHVARDNGRTSGNLPPPVGDMDHYPTLRRQRPPSGSQRSRVSSGSRSRDSHYIPTPAQPETTPTTEADRVPERTRADDSGSSPGGGVCPAVVPDGDSVLVANQEAGGGNHGPGAEPSPGGTAPATRPLGVPQMDPLLARPRTPTVHLQLPPLLRCSLLFRRKLTARETHLVTGTARPG